MTLDSISDNIRIEEQSHIADHRAALADDARRGLTLDLKELPPKYFYDERGSELFEEICGLPEYYQTRTEAAILDAVIPDLVDRYRPGTLVEFGSGSSSKTRLILSEMARRDLLRRYVPIDISREILLSTAENLVREYPGLRVDAVIGDFNDGLPSIQPEGPCLIIFLGSTIGNFRRDDAVGFLRRVSGRMRDEDLFLLGVDLVKDPARLNAAYDDAAGVTAEFNLNVLRVINRELGGKFDIASFSHYAFFNPRESQIEMHLASRVDQTVAIEALGIEVPFTRGETILTEISRKFTPASIARLLEEGGLEQIGFHTDPENLFALTLSRRAT